MDQAYAFISTTSTTFQPENPLENAIIDNPGLVRRRRRKTSARELEVLEMVFKECEKPSREVREEISRKTGMDEKSVQNRRQSSRRQPKEQPVQKQLTEAAPNTDITPVTTSSRIPLAVKTNIAPLSPKTKNIQKPSLETTCLSSRAPKRQTIQRTPSIRLGEGIGGKATVVFEETETPLPPEPVKKRKPTGKPIRTKRLRREEGDPGKENIPPMRRNTPREPRSADLEEIALGLVALRDGR